MFGAAAVTVCVCVFEYGAWCVVIKCKTRTEGITKSPEMNDCFGSDISLSLL